MHARQIAIWIVRKKTMASFPEIGLAFQRDHSTVLHSFHKIDSAISNDQNLSQEVDKIIAAIEGGML
jgi:chromosomal replication initiator protein